ncbi:MAG: hypothetical protein M1813_006457 [Trichoglossum hirsutum]|nr:MAG: hypothetical protein M1813_006457 [Trichoglossum hirsutum]
MSTISKRVRAAVTDLEHQTWRALRESGGALLPYLSSDCVLLLHDGQMLDSSTSPTLSQYLNGEFKPWASYEIYDVRVVEIDMMAAVICYGVTASRARRHGKAPRVYEGVASSTWRQDASGDWKLCVHQQTLA